MSFAGQGDLPADVVRLAPMDWRICAWRNAIRQRPSPLRPVVQRWSRAGSAATANLIGQRWQTRQRDEDHQKNCRGHAGPSWRFDPRSVKAMKRPRARLSRQVLENDPRLARMSLSNQ